MSRLAQCAPTILHVVANTESSNFMCCSLCVTSCFLAPSAADAALTLFIGWHGQEEAALH